MSSTPQTATLPARPLSVLERFGTFLHAVAFVFGTSTIFTLVFGLPTYWLGQALGQYKPLLALLGGIVVIVFGLVTMGLLDIPLLNYDTRKQWAGRRDWGYLSSYFMGIFFAAGWSPCIGTTLGAIMTMSYSQSTVAQGLLLLAAYSLGLGVPFLLCALALNRARGVLRRLNQRAQLVERVSGVFLVLMGLMVFANVMGILSALMFRTFGWFL